jgi:hypothetical protein
MKTRDKMLFSLGLVLLIILYWFLFFSKKSEGFFDDPTAYNALRGRLQDELGPYCELSAFVKDQVNEMQQGLKAVSGSLPSESDIKAMTKSSTALNTQSLMSAAKISRETWYDFGGELQFNSMYKSVYKCTDGLAKSRPSCSSPNPNMNYVPCSTYLNLPNWTDEMEVIAALRKITNDLPERLVRESDWFDAVIVKIRSGLEAGARPQAGDNPPGVPPSKAQMAEYEKEAKKQEGFTCSLEAMDYLKRKRLEAEAKSCTPLTGSSEIARVNRLLDDPSVRSSVKRMRSMYDDMLRLKSDLEKLKNGTLYDWQKDGPKKSYAPCEAGGDRIKAFICSLRNMT